MGDAVITTDNEVLLRNTRELKTVICEQRAVEKQKITESLLRKANKNGFGNNVGSVTNRCTAMFDILAKFEKGSKEYDEMLYRITCMQGYQQEIIDSCKGIIPKEVPKEWYDYKAVKINDEDSEEVVNKKLHLQNLLANKKPYFFIYNYKHVKSKHDKYIKDSNSNCIINFRTDIEGLRKMDVRTEEQEEFLRYYDLLSVTSNNGSTINKICNRLEEDFKNLKTRIKEVDFNVNILKTNKRINRSLYKSVEELYITYKDAVYSFMSNATKMDEEEKKSSRKVFVDKFKEEAFNICSNEEDLCNILVDMLYKTASSKQFVWDICGEYIVNKLLKDNDNTINYPVESAKGDICWNGVNYEIINVKVGVDRCWELL